MHARVLRDLHVWSNESDPSHTGKNCMLQNTVVLFVLLACAAKYKRSCVSITHVQSSVNKTIGSEGLPVSIDTVLAVFSLNLRPLLSQ